MTDASVEPNALLTAACRYANLGLCVIRLQPMSKYPDLSRWKQYQKRRPTDAEIRDWFSRPGNLAVVCGEISGGFFVIDFDESSYGAKDGDVIFRFCFPGYEPPYQHPIVRTSKGVHLWARKKGGGKPPNRSLKGRGGRGIPIEVRGEGGYVVAPPSVHPDGATYRFLGEWQAIPEVDAEALLEDLVLRREEWPFFMVLRPSWVEGTRHHTALGFAAFAAKKLRWDEDRTKEFVRRACAAVQDPEFADRLKAVETTYAALAAGEDVAYLQFLGPELSAKLEALAPKRRELRPKKSEGPAEHAQYVVDVMKRFTFATMDDTDEIYVYRDGVYRRGAEALIRAEVERMLSEEEDSAKMKLTEEVVDAIRRRTYVKRKSFNPPGRLCLLNGILDLTTLTISPHTPDERFTIQLPVAYDSKAERPRFMTFLEQVVPDEMDRETLQRMAGYCLEPGNKYQIAFMLVGTGDNGKSTFLSVLRELLGRENVASEPLQVLAENRFAAAQLWGKLANICADIPATGIKSTGMFKMLTGGDLVRGEEKFREAFYFENQAKLIFSANQLPDVNDRSLAFWRRWGPGLVRFPVNVNDLPGGKDPDLLAKLTAELSGILNWALNGLCRLREEGGFPKRQSDLEREWKQRADSLFWFVSECVEVVPNAYVSKVDFYEAYVAFCEERGVTVKKPEVVGKELPGLIPQVRSEGRRVGEDRRVVRVWGNIRMIQLGDRVTPETPVTEPPSGWLSVTGVTSVTGSADGPTLTSDQIARSLRSAIHALDRGTGQGAEESLIIADLEAEGIPRETTLAWLRRWREDGTVYCPRNGFYRLTEEPPEGLVRGYGTEAPATQAELPGTVGLVRSRSGTEPGPSILPIFYHGREVVVRDVGGGEIPAKDLHEQIAWRVRNRPGIPVSFLWQEIAPALRLPEDVDTRAVIEGYGEALRAMRSWPEASFPPLGGNDAGTGGGSGES